MASERALTTTDDQQAAMIERVVVQGDLSQLSPPQRVTYYNQVCESLGLNPLTRPFDYIKLNGKLTLYAKRDAADQLRARDRVSVSITSREHVDGLCIVTARAVMPDGRTDESTGAVSIKGLAGDNLANAIMKAETKAKRRVTLSIVGLGWLDETEVGTIQGARTVEVDGATGEILPASIPARVSVADPDPTGKKRAQRDAALPSRQPPPTGEAIRETIFGDAEEVPMDNPVDAIITRVHNLIEARLHRHVTDDEGNETEAQWKDTPATDGQRSYLASTLTTALGKKDDADRYAVYRLLTGKAKGADMSMAEAGALLDWLLTKDPRGKPQVRPSADKEAQMVWREAMRRQGQQELPTGESDA